MAIPGLSRSALKQRSEVLIVKEKKDAVLERRNFLMAALGATVSFGWSASATSFDRHFPVSVSHAFGTTIIPEPPRRIVTLGWGGEDALLALGVTPIAMPSYGQFPNGVLPWVANKIGDAKPTLLNQGLIDYEALALLKPDLILAIRTNINAQAWHRLQHIAPTVAYRSGPLQADWKEITELAGAAIGLSGQASDLISATKVQLRDLAKVHPHIRDRTFVFGNYFPASNAIDVYLPPDGRVASLLELGLRIAPSALSFASSTRRKIVASISLELLDTIETDLLILWFPPGARLELEGNSLFKRFSPVVNGGYVPLDDPLAVWVACNPSVLSIPYGFPKFASRLEGTSKHSVGIDR